MNKCAIFLPVYNGELYLSQTIESVLNQSFKDFNLIIYNDGSSDKSTSIISKYLHDKRIIYIDNKENSGAGFAFYQMFRKYKNYEYIAMIGQDDIYASNYLQSQIDTLEKSNAIVAFSNIEYINKNGEIFQCDIFKHELLNSHDRSEILLTLFHQNILCAPASLIKNKNIDNIDLLIGYNNDRLQDQELWMNLILQNTFIYNENAYIKYRQHENNLSSPNFRMTQYKLEYISMMHRLIFNDEFFRYIKSLPNSNEYLEKIVFELVSKIKDFDNAMILLIINFCEKILLLNFQSGYIIETLYMLYLQIGLTQKYLQANKSQKIAFPVFVDVPTKFQNKILKTNLFETNSEIAISKKLKTLRIFYFDNIENAKYVTKPAIIITEANKNYIYSDKLIISDVDNCKNDIIKYIQDFAFLYKNNLFLYGNDQYYIKYENNKLIEEAYKIADDANNVNNKINIIYNSRSWKLIQKIKNIRKR